MRAFTIALLLLASAALGKGKKSCEDYCEEDKVLCVKVCKEKGGPKVAPHCGSVCGDGKKQCEAACKSDKK